MLRSVKGRNGGEGLERAEAPHRGLAGPRQGSGLVSVDAREQGGDFSS